LMGAQRLAPEFWKRVGEGTYRYQPFRKGFYQLMVNGEPAPEVRVEPDATEPPRLEPLQWCAFHGFVYFRVEPLRFIDQYEIEVPALEIGLGLYNARNVTVRNLDISMFRLDGINVSGNSRNIRLMNIRSSNNGRAGFTVTGTSQVEVGGLDLR